MKAQTLETKRLHLRKWQPSNFATINADQEMMQQFTSWLKVK